MSSTGQTGTRSQPLRATLVEYEDAPTECTIHPVDPPTERETTEWITAREGSFASLANLR